MKNLLILALAVSLVGSSCVKSGANEVSDIIATDPAANITSTPAPPQVKIFTAAKLTDYVRRNSAELDKLLAGQRVMVSGAVKTVDNAYVDLQGSGDGTVNCYGAVFYQEEWKKLDSYYSDFNHKRAPRPMATVSGVYKKSVAPSAFLEDCKIETATK